MWSLLVHEIGHVIEGKYKIAQSILKEGGRNKYLELSLNWLCEFFSDFVALRTIGPAFFIAFVSHAISLRPDTYIPGRSHPQHQIRVELMYKYLKENNLVSNTAQNYYNLFRGLCRVWGIPLFPSHKYFLVIEQSCPRCGSLVREKIGRFLLPWDEVYYKIEEQLKRTKVLSTLTPYTKDNQINCAKLENKLKDGVLISAYFGKEPQPADIEELEKMHKAVQNEDATITNKSKVKKTYNVLKLFKETPSTPSEIVNAAWNVKTERNKEILLNTFTPKSLEAKDNKLHSSFERYDKYLDSFDENIQKSIETAAIHEFYKA